MKLQLVLPGQGALWVRNGFRIFARRPLAFCVLFIIYLVTGQLLMLLSPVGPLLLFALVPLASLGFMIATCDALEGRFPRPAVFIEPLRGSRPQMRSQLLLCAIYSAAIALIVWLTDALAGEAIEAFQKAMSSGTATPDTLIPLLSDGNLQAGVLLFLSLTSALAVPYWYAPALVHWGGQGWAKSLFFSTIACWRNKGALTVYALAWGGVVILFALLSNIVFALLDMPKMVVLVATPAALMFSTVFYASLYFTFADCFEPSEGADVIPLRTP
jgi:hypothetical protein